MRRVRSVHLTAPSDALLRRGALLLEDALRTASLPEGDGGLLWLVRSFSVGRIHPHASSTSLALTIEGRLRDWGRLARHGDDPAADTAPVVVFRHALEAHILLARRLSQGQPTQGWFWPLAVPAWEPGQAPAEALRRILLSSFALPGGVASAAAWLDALVSATGADLVLASLNPADGAPLLEASGWSMAGEAMAGPQTPGTPSPAWDRALRTWIPRWGPGDERTLWLAAMALGARNPGRLDSPALLEAARALIRRIQTPLKEEEASAAGPATGERQAGSNMPEPEAGSAAPLPPGRERASKPSESPVSPWGSAAGGSPATSRSTTGPTRAEAAPASQGPPSGDGDPARSPAVAREGGSFPTAPPPATDPIHARDPGSGDGAWMGLETSATEFAGFPFLIPLLRQLGIEGWLEKHPLLLEWDWPRQLLLRLASELGMAGTDPVLDALDSEGLAPAAEPSVLKSLSRHWSQGLRRWSQRPGALPLGELVRRSGTVVSSRTHLDIGFDLRQAEIRVRRLGLDLDPGWVPWLGRVVQFHYEVGGWHGH